MKKTATLFGLILLMAITNACKPPEYDFFSTIYGTVSDSETGAPLGNATVALNPGGKTQTTGSDGRFEFPDLDPTQYTVTVQKTAYQTNRKTLTAVSGERCEANVGLQPEK